MGRSYPYQPPCLPRAAQTAQIEFSGIPHHKTIEQLQQLKERIQTLPTPAHHQPPLHMSFSLPADAFRRMDESSDTDFYRMPRLVTHIDEQAIAAVTQLYREYFPPQGAILDLMSSWVSHLPEEVAYREVVGLGMNEAELSQNPRLSEWVVHDLNSKPQLPFEDGRFDGAGCCVSIDYLTQPIEVLRDLARVVVPGAPVVITFSNRCFPTKAVAIWHHLDERGRIGLVHHYLEAAGGWTDIQGLNRSNPDGHDPLYAVVGRREK